MRPWQYAVFSTFLHLGVSAQQHNLYLLSGQGSDERIFQELDLDSMDFKIHYIPYVIPDKGASMKQYAHRMAETIDTTAPFSLVGVSLGGMLCVEMAHFLEPHQVIILSSAKQRSELPFGYRVQRYLPFYAIFPRSVLKYGALIAQPVFEPDRKSHKEVCKAMLKAKDKTFTKRSIRMIVNWQRRSTNAKIIHIHGNNDHTLPIRNIKPTHLIEGGSHMMTLTRGNEISKLLSKHLKS